jgi:hypothetical protein
MCNEKQLLKEESLLPPLLKGIYLIAERQEETFIS